VISKISQLNAPKVRYQQDRTYSRVNFTSNPQNTTQIHKKKDNTVSHILLGLGALAVASLGIAFLPKMKNFAESVKLKREFKRIYNNIWTEVSQTFEQKGLKIVKPSLGFSKDEKSINIGAYRPGSNKIIINLHQYNSYEYIIHRNKSFLARGNMTLHTLEEVEKLKKKGSIDSSWTVKKLNQSEKMFFFTHVMAHEQRHCAQFHLVLNDANFGPDFLLKHIAKNLKQKNPTKTSGELMKQAKLDCPYWANFKAPKKLTKLSLKAPITHNNHRIRFFARDFASNFERYTSKNWDKYRLNVLEIDANAFSANYLTKNKKFQTNCDKEIIRIITRFENIKNSKNINNFFEQSAAA